jgi:hypothetical protein
MRPWAAYVSRCAAYPGIPTDTGETPDTVKKKTAAVFPLERRVNELLCLPGA